jgi:hypothetical protein
MKKEPPKVEYKPGVIEYRVTGIPCSINGQTHLVDAVVTADMAQIAAEALGGWQTSRSTRARVRMKGALKIKPEGYRLRPEPRT